MVEWILGPIKKLGSGPGCNMINGFPNMIDYRVTRLMSVYEFNEIPPYNTVSFSPGSVGLEPFLPDPHAHCPGRHPEGVGNPGYCVFGVRHTVPVTRSPAFAGLLLDIDIASDYSFSFLQNILSELFRA